MKRLMKILLYLLLIILLSSCFFNSKQNDEVNQAKEEMGITEVDNISGPIEEIENNNMGNGNGKNIEEKEKNIIIENITQDVFLEFDDLSGVNLFGGEIEITGNTLTNVDKINVEFSNNQSDFPYDNYTLKKFKAGDKTFIYRAFSNFQTLDFGTNEYIFSAFSGDNISKTKITIIVKKEDKDNSISNIGDFDINFLPIGENFGEPTEIGNGKITYSDIKGLNIEIKSENTYDCGQTQETGEYYVTQILDNKLDSYYWWNTCRPFGNNEGISFYVLRLDGTSYVYEKHIYLNNGIYGIYNLEVGENFILEDDDNSVKIEKLREKNNELKEKNDTFSVVEIVNDLFTKILNNNVQ